MRERGRGGCLISYLQLPKQFRWHSVQPSCQNDISPQCLPSGPHIPRPHPKSPHHRSSSDYSGGREWGAGAAQGSSPGGSTSSEMLCGVWGPAAPSTTQPYFPVSSSCRLTISTCRSPPPMSVRNMRPLPGALRSTAEVTSGRQPSCTNRHHTLRALTSWSR